MRIGAEDLLKEHGYDRVSVAVAWIKGELAANDDFVRDLVDETTVAAAKARIELQATGIIGEIKKDENK